MPEWKPQPFWEGQEVFIIGGGHSLRDFDWSLLLNERTIGCNQAFRLGEAVCDICVFCDSSLIFEKPEPGGGKLKPRAGFYDELSKFRNPVVTNDNALKHRPEPWLKWMPRRTKGLHHDALGFNANTGATAINLALILGAKTVYLLGFDMFLDDKGRPNWHDNLIDKPSNECYERFLASFGHVSRELPIKFPGCQVFNVTKKSNLNIFPKLDFDEFWEKRKNKDGR